MKATEHKLHKIRRSLKFCKYSGKRAHLCVQPGFKPLFLQCEQVIKVMKPAPKRNERSEQLFTAMSTLFGLVAKHGCPSLIGQCHICYRFRGQNKGRTSVVMNTEEHR